MLQLDKEEFFFFVILLLQLNYLQYDIYKEFTHSTLITINYLQYNAYHKLTYNTFLFFPHTTLTGNYNTYTDAIYNYN